MAKKAKALPGGMLSLEEPDTLSIYAESGFDHAGAHYSPGIHNGLPAKVAREIAAAKKAELCERPAPRAEATEAPKAGETDGKGGAATAEGGKNPAESGNNESDPKRGEEQN